jgi:hypothetical protein
MSEGWYICRLLLPSEAPARGCHSALVLLSGQKAMWCSVQVRWRQLGEGSYQVTPALRRKCSGKQPCGAAVS